MKIKISRQASKIIGRMNRTTQIRIKNALEGLAKDPPAGDISTMQGKENAFRLRVGKYRILYHYEEDRIKIDDVGTRGDIYK